MSITAQELEQLMEEVEREDPIDFADLPFNDANLRSVIANHVCDMAAALENFSEEDRHLTLLAVAAKLVLENFVLHLRLMHKQGEPISHDVGALLRDMFHKK
ncbi:malonyl CoA-acyl carrier protein transacylase [Oxalobacteraceae bacterium GrIS 2.11]